MLRSALCFAYSLAILSPLAGQVRTVPHTAVKGMVVCVSPDAADIGAEIMKKGGTAVDAAVAVAFAEAVTHPAAGNIFADGHVRWMRRDVVIAGPREAGKDLWGHFD